MPMTPAIDAVDVLVWGGGIGGLVARASGMAGAGLAFARMYLMAPKSNALPRSIRLQPAW